MTVSAYDVHKAVLSRVAAQLPGKIIAYPNATPPPRSSLWSRVTVIFGETRRADFGCPNARFRTVGLLEFQVFANLGVGEKAALQLADELAAPFRSIQADGITYRTPTIVSNGAVNDKWQINVSCPFQADQTLA